MRTFSGVGKWRFDFSGSKNLNSKIKTIPSDKIKYTIERRRLVKIDNVRELVITGVLGEGWYISKVSKKTEWVGPFNSKAETEVVANYYFEKRFAKQFKQNKDFKESLINNSIFFLKNK